MSNWRCFLAAGAMLAVTSYAGLADAASFMRTGGRTTQPVGHYEFCLQIPIECQEKNASPSPLELTRPMWARLVEVNNDVNTTVIPRTDMEMWGQEEVWSYPGAYGDCEDYVLEKRRRLIADGVSPSDVLITVVRQPNGDGHAVLTVDTSLGDFVLDNLEPKILPWDQTDYEYLKRQSAKNSGVWLSVNDGRAVAVGSVR